MRMETELGVRISMGTELNPAVLAVTDIKKASTQLMGDSLWQYFKAAMPATTSIKDATRTSLVCTIYLRPLR